MEVVSPGQKTTKEMVTKVQTIRDIQAKAMMAMKANTLRLLTTTAVRDSRNRGTKPITMVSTSNPRITTLKEIILRPTLEGMVGNCKMVLIKNTSVTTTMLVSMKVSNMKFGVVSIIAKDKIVLVITLKTTGLIPIIRATTTLMTIVVRLTSMVDLTRIFPDFRAVVITGEPLKCTLILHGIQSIRTSPTTATLRKRIATKTSIIDRVLRLIMVVVEAVIEAIVASP